MENILWWYWILLGIVLILLELVVPSFTIFWFGLGAVLTGILLAVLPAFPIEWQLLVFSATSIGFTFLWFRYFGPRKSAGSPVTDEKQAIGQTGIAATRAMTPGETGKAVFSVPVMGHDSWEYMADEPIDTGNRLRITAVMVEKNNKGSNDAPKKILKVEKVG